MTEENITAYVALAISLGTTLLALVNHKRIRSTCCKREIVASLDIESTTPPLRAV
jgi:hypothetical protein